MKKFLIIAAILIAAFFVIPEKPKNEIAEHVKMESYNSKVTQFLIGTKVGRKISYIFIRKKVKKKIKEAKKDIQETLN